MTFASKIGSLVRNAITSNPSVYQSIRCISTTELFVHGILYGTDAQSLKEAFLPFGNVVDSRVILKRKTGKPRGFDFVNFQSPEEAAVAISSMDGKELNGCIVKVNYAVEFRIAGKPSSKLFIGGIPFATDDQTLGEAFSPFGKVVESKVITDKETGRSRGYGFVTFQSTEDAAAAISSMDGKEIDGHILEVNYATGRRGGGYGRGYLGGGTHGGDSYCGGGNYGGGSVTDSSGGNYAGADSGAPSH